MKTYIFKLPHTAPELISLNEVKAQLKLNEADTFEDALLIQYRNAAIKYAEDYTSRNFNQAKYQFQFFGFQNMYEFTKSPVTAIDQVKYLNVDGNWQVLAPEFYELLNEDEFKSVIHFITDDQTLPTLKSSNGIRVKIDVTVGYATPEELPEQDKQAIFLIFSFYYEKRDDSVQNLPRASTNLLKRFYY